MSEKKALKRESAQIEELLNCASDYIGARIMEYSGKEVSSEQEAKMVEEVRKIIKNKENELRTSMK
ncbi:MAG: hypothetical protein HOI53_07195 [Francisellaceae bacterium]|jgi:hypothetical protein|nr:hypothetical protein [Francisellaceae bacterium]MBT6207798.1 hypothetical protein [Francisellaceae bacterium]MBT6538054.1 hypothetical protein [Francisellaceae bacterium]